MAYQDKLKPITENQTSGSMVPTKSYQQKLKPVGSEKKDGVLSDIGNRFNQAKVAVQGVQRGEMALPRGGLRVAGAVTGAVGDISSRTLSALTPDFIGAPLQVGVANVVGKVADTNVGRKAVQEYEQFATKHPEIVQDIKDVTNIASVVPIGKGLQIAGGGIKKALPKIPPKTERIVNKRMNEIGNIENNYVQGRKAMSFSKDAGVESRKRVASTDVLVNSVDENGLIRTKQPGGAVEQYKDQTIGEAEGVVRKNLEGLGERVSLAEVANHLKNSVKNSSLTGDDLVSALNRVEREINGYKIRVDKNGTIPLTLVHDAKVAQYGNINYLTPPEVAKINKTIAKGLRTLVENKSKFPVEKVNAEIGKYLEDIALLERLDGKRVKGGKLGKYFSQISGNIGGAIAGGAIGGPLGSAIGTVVGGELAGAIKGSSLSRTLGGKTGLKAPKSKIIQDAINSGKFKKLPVKSLPSEYTDVLPTIDFGKKPTRKPSKLPTIR